MKLPPVCAPVPVPERVPALDVLRGLAVLGILAVNLQSFALPEAAYANPTIYGDFAGANFAAWLLVHVFAEGKFIALFSLLFGAGIVAFNARLEARGQGSLGLHYRRMGWLAAFGLIHAYALWYGDILVTYAVTGMVAYAFRGLAPRWQFMLGAASLLPPLLLVLLLQAGVAFLPEELRRPLMAEWQPDAEALALEVAAYRGGWLEQMPRRALSALYLQVSLPLVTGWWTGGLMLMGMALFRWGVLSAERSAAFYRRLVVAGLLAGTPLIAAGVAWNLAHGWSAERSMFVGTQFNAFGALGFAAAWLGLVMLAVQRGVWPAGQRALAAVGRAALSSYLGQTLVGTTLFYGHGLGLFGWLERWELLLVLAVVWAGQIACSILWLRRFRYGPAEWLWRSLTYWRPQPLRRTKHDERAATPPFPAA